MSSTQEKYKKEKQVLDYEVRKLVHLFNRLDGRTGNAHAWCAGGMELNLEPTKSYTALQTVRHRFNIYASSCVALAL